MNSTVKALDTAKKAFFDRIDEPGIASQWKKCLEISSGLVISKEIRFVNKTDKPLSKATCPRGLAAFCVIFSTYPTQAQLIRAAAG
ncbi:MULTISPECIES: hypothetical protein [Methylomonas]|uniref:hypothetical protein n=1 Tax=Methylomonas TaxID=416 RepID=UPI000A8B1697|nr:MULTISPECIES: hypothetical protein [Methylomonas]